MSTLGNILWIFLGGGIVLFLEYLLGGLLLCVTIIGIPFGVQCIKLSMLALVPFGKRVEDTAAASGCLSVAMNVLWIPLRRHRDRCHPSPLRPAVRDHNRRHSVREAAPQAGRPRTDAVRAHISLVRSGGTHVPTTL